jgi:RNAse (barnase) inhibitor barstar
MIQFNDDKQSWGRLDFQIISRGFYKLYSNATQLNDDISWLKLENYSIIEFDCAAWIDKETMYNSLHEKFDFPVYFGRNWDALQESLDEIEIVENGCVVVFQNLDLAHYKLRQNLVEIFLTSAQRHLIFRKYLLVLITVSNRNFSLKPMSKTIFYWH